MCEEEKKIYLWIKSRIKNGDMVRTSRSDLIVTKSEDLVGVEFLKGDLTQFKGVSSLQGFTIEELEKVEIFRKRSEPLVISYSDILGTKINHTWERIDRYEKETTTRSSLLVTIIKTSELERLREKARKWDKHYEDLIMSPFRYPSIF